MNERWKYIIFYFALEDGECFDPHERCDGSDEHVYTTTWNYDAI